MSIRTDLSSVEDCLMRTTLSIDPEVLSAAKRLAAARSQTVGQVISELARKGLSVQAPAAARGKFPVFTVSQHAVPLTLEDVQRAEDEM
jgi:hypothetical protein